MRKPKVSVTGKKPNYTSCTLLRSGTYFHPDRDSSLLRCSVTRRPFATPSRPVGREIHAFLDSLSKIGRYRSFDVFIILLESVSVLFCVFHISFRARSYGKIVRLFNLPTGKKNSGLTYTCQVSRLRRESHACGLKTSISRRLTPASRFLTPD